MKMISWNVNGLRAVVKKGFEESVRSLDPDVICLQEIKLQENQNDFALEGYTGYYNYAEKKGYSGTAVLTRIPPVSVTYGMGIEEHDHEGRIITAEFEDFYLVCCYTPNSKQQLERLAYRQVWEDALREYLIALTEKKPVVYTGDMNVAHQEIDLKNPKTNHNSAGFTDQEREKFSQLLASGFVDTFRYLYPDRTGEYSWWSYIGGARGRNAGWRIDYFVVSEQLKDRIAQAGIHQSIMGSDHCPVSLEIRDN